MALLPKMIYNHVQVNTLNYRDKMGNIQEIKNLKDENRTVMYHKHTGNSSVEGGCYTTPIPKYGTCSNGYHYMRDSTDQYGIQYGDWRCLKCGAQYKAYNSYPPATHKSLIPTSYTYGLGCGFDET